MYCLFQYPVFPNKRSSVRMNNCPVKAPDTSVIRYLIQPLPTDNGAPFF